MHETLACLRKPVLRLIVGPLAYRRSEYFTSTAYRRTFTKTSTTSSISSISSTSSMQPYSLLRLHRFHRCTPFTSSTSSISSMPPYSLLRLHRCHQFTSTTSSIIILTLSFFASGHRPFRWIRCDFQTRNGPFGTGMVRLSE